MSYIVEEIARNSYKKGFEEGERQAFRQFLKNMPPEQIAKELEMTREEVNRILAEE